MRRWRSTALLLFVLGATLGTFLDALHVLSGTTAYAQPFLFGQAAWVPLLFGLAAVALGLGRLALGHLVRASPQPASSAEALGAMACFALAYVESAFLPQTAAVLTLGLTALGLFVWLDRSIAGCLAVLGAAIAGPLAEAALSLAGAFHYTGARAHLVLGVPLWLPILYACAGTAVGAVARFRSRG